MTVRKINFILLMMIYCSSCHMKSQKSNQNIAPNLTQPIINKSIMQKVKFTAENGLEITADYYGTDNNDAKLIILCHQARFSRGEYIETAPKFNALGYNCLALDQRSGSEVNNIINETAKRSSEQNKGNEYVDALPDIESALDYGKNVLRAKEIMIIGSSYSASLAILMATMYEDDIKAIACYSPGNYFQYEDMEVSDYASKVDIPTFITSAKSEVDVWKEIYDHIPTDDKKKFIPAEEGIHGSRALWEANDPNGENWKALKEFMDEYFPSH